MSQSEAAVTKLRTPRNPRLPQNLLDERRRLAMDMIEAGNTNLQIESETKTRFGTAIGNDVLAKLRKMSRRKARKTVNTTRPSRKVLHAMPPGSLQLAAQYMRNAMIAEGVDMVTVNAKTGQITATVKTEKTWDLDK